MVGCLTPRPGWRSSAGAARRTAPASRRVSMRHARRAGARSSVTRGAACGGAGLQRHDTDCVPRQLCISGGAARGWFHPSGYGTLGYALPAALGAKMATPERAVIALAGDFGLQFTLQGAHDRGRGSTEPAHTRLEQRRSRADSRRHGRCRTLPPLRWSRKTLIFRHSPPPAGWPVRAPKARMNSRGRCEKRSGGAAQPSSRRSKATF